MYMHYILDYLLKRDQMNSQKNKNSILKESDTLILTLDGDMQFHPTDALRIVDFVVDNPKIGAAAGFTIPVGTGILELAQKFEYSLQHWLSKSTEETLGSVLVTPGCFSVLRGKALLDTNTLIKFASKATKPAHFLKYYQGEDRWLITLLLKRGWRASYLPFSYAYTIVPSTIEELYKQRRRWNNSIMANMIELCMNWKTIISKNSNISVFFLPYILFQILFFIFAPGAVLISLVGDLDNYLHAKWWIELAINLVPIILFVIVCLTMKQKYQLKLAFVMTIVYSVLQLLKVVFMFVDSITNGLEGQFAYIKIVIFGMVLTGIILHPPHWSTLVGGIFYFAMIPSLYLYSIIYSICNLTDVSWGTRENNTEIKPDANMNIGDKAQTRSNADKVDENSGIHTPMKLSIPTKASNHQQNTINTLSIEEVSFWNKCISTYLKPEHLTATSYNQMKEIEAKLKSMRIYILTFMLVVNSLWVGGVSILHEIHLNVFVPKDVFSFSLYRFGVEKDVEEIKKDFYQVDVVMGLVSISVTLIASIQMVGMICHWISMISYAVSKAKMD